VLNRVSVLYSFDPVSGMTDVARLCGCPVVILAPRPPGEHDWSGVGFGFVTPFDSHAFRERYYQRIAASRVQLAEFVRMTQLVPA